MYKKARLTGIKQVTQGLNEAFKKIEKGSVKGLIHAAIIIRRDMEDTSPKIPIDTGNLRASWFAVTKQGNQSTGGQFKGEDGSKEKGLHSQAISQAKGMTSMIINPTIVLGFSASYAEIVHEMIGADFTSPRVRRGKEYTPRPGSGAKFFESAVYRNKDKILQIIRKEAQV